MIIPVFILFFFACFLVFHNKGYKSKARQNTIILFFFVIALIIIATFRPKEMSDYRNYFMIFHTERASRIESGFMWIVHWVRTWNREPLVLFGIFAALSISIKIEAIRKMSPFIWLSIVMYISNIFILHDMIQIRCAIASGFLLWAIKYIYERKLWRFLLVSSLALLFHNSAIIIFPLWFLNTEKPQKKIFMWLIPLSYLLALSGHLFGSYAQLIKGENYQHLWNIYSMTSSHETINIFNLAQIFRCLICFLLLINVDRIIKYNHLIILLVKIYTISLSSFVLFSDIPVIAFRISELLQSVEILLIPMLVYIFSSRSYGRLLCIAIAFSILLANTFYIRLLI